MGMIADIGVFILIVWIASLGFRFIDGMNLEGKAGPRAKL